MIGSNEEIDCIAEMEIDMLVNILETKSMALVFITSPMATATKGHGMKAGSKVMACILSEMVMQNVVNGIMASLRPLCLY